MILLIHHIQIIQNTFTADHLHTNTIMEFHYRQKLHHSDLTCMSHMSSTARTDIRSRKIYNTNLTCQLLLASVIQSLQFFRSWISNHNFLILPHFLIHFSLNLRKLRFIQHPIQIHCDYITTHMKSHIIITILRMDNTTHHMLSGMLLHQIKPTLPVNLTLNLRTHFQRLLRIMKQLAILLMNLRHLHIPQSSHITRLAATFRIKSTLIQNHSKPILMLPTLQNRRCKFLFIHILII